MMTDIFENKPDFFVGREVEKTKFFGENTLFVKGDISLLKLKRVILTCPDSESISHVYLGSSKTHSLLLVNDELESILSFLNLADYHVTIETEYSDVGCYVDMLSKYSNVMLNISLSLDVSILEQISVKIEPMKPFKDGAGIYCMTPKEEDFTPWSAYYEDKII